MYIEQLEIHRIKCFDSLTLNSLSKTINLFLGKNNSGKSTILRSIQNFQDPTSKIFAWARRDNSLEVCSVSMDVSVNEPEFYYGIGSILPGTQVRIRMEGNDDAIQVNNSHTLSGKLRQNTRDGAIYPLWSSRKHRGFSTASGLEVLNDIDGSLYNLASLLDEILGGSKQQVEAFQNALSQILDFEVSVKAIEGGRTPGLLLDSGDILRIETLGDGVAHILGMLAVIIGCKNKIILIEEPETDIHPHALKHICKLIREFPNGNQFLISTHSNIVLRHLTDQGTKIYKVFRHNSSLPTSAVEEVISFSDRLSLLSDLGYSVSDYELYEAWLILEESSAQRLIREFLIPMFTPRLNGRLGLISSGGVDKIEPFFEDFFRLMVYVGQQPIYNDNLLWVACDGDGPGQKVTQRLRTKFAKLKEGQIRSWQQNYIEDYYPEKFIKLAEAKCGFEFGTKDWGKKQQLHKAFFDILEEQPKAEVQSEFQFTATEIIELLREIDARLGNP